MLQAEGDKLRCRCCSNPLLPEVLLTPKLTQLEGLSLCPPSRGELLPSQARVLPSSSPQGLLL